MKNLIIDKLIVKEKNYNKVQQSTVYYVNDKRYFGGIITLTQLKKKYKDLGFKLIVNDMGVSKRNY